jgi:hypothetical protein
LTTRLTTDAHKMRRVAFGPGPVSLVVPPLIQAE